MRLMRRVERIEAIEFPAEEFCLAEQLKAARERVLREGPRPRKTKEELEKMLAAGGLSARIAEAHMRVIVDKNIRD